MRRIFIDENLSPLLAKPLAATYRRTRFDTWTQLNLSGTDDLELFQTLSAMDFSMIITKDRAQLDNPDERAALAAAGLHWLGAPEIDGVDGVHVIAQQLAVVVPAVGQVLEQWPDAPTAFHLGQPLVTPFAAIEPL